jgi:hypothetical protein
MQSRAYATFFQKIKKDPQHLSQNKGHYEGYPLPSLEET